MDAAENLIEFTEYTFERYRAAFVNAASSSSVMPHRHASAGKLCRHGKVTAHAVPLNPIDWNLFGAQRSLNLFAIDRERTGEVAETITAAKNERKLHMFKRALTVKEVKQAGRPGRTKLYEEIRKGRLRAVKFGRSTRILADEFERYLASAPELQSKRHNSTKDEG